MLLFLLSNLSRATPISWLTNAINLSEIKTYALPKDSDTVNSFNTNKVACNTNSFIVKPNIIVNKNVLQQEQRQTVCSYGVSGGSYGNGLLLKSGTKTAGQLKPAMSTYGPALPVPGSPNIVELASAGGYAYKVYLVNNAYSRLSMHRDITTQTVTYILPATPVADNIKSSSGGDLFIDPNTVAFSENGQWLVADGLNSGFVRINLNTGEVKQFAYNFSTPNKSVSSFNAISNDGNLAIVGATWPFQKTNLYDLSTCQTKAGQFYLACANRDLHQFIATQRSKYFGTQSVHFITNEAIQAYSIYNYTSGATYSGGLFNIDIAGGNLTKVNYLALGDSFSSGEGAYNYRPETNIDFNKCHQSFDSYGFLLHKNLSITNSFKSVTCSGAKIKDIILQTDEEKSYNNNDSQAYGKTDIALYDRQIYTEFLPGYRLQNNFVRDNKPQIVTMSIGGNDIGFSSILTKCVNPFEKHTCYNTYTERKQVVGTINNLYPKLLSMYQQLKRDAAVDAKIYIVGYPEIAVANGNCANNVHFDNDEIIFSNNLIAYLNGMVKSAADHAGVYYVDITNALAGHRLCETKSNQVAVHGLTLSNEFTLSKPFAAESYHPNKLGQQLMANTIAAQTNNLNAVMPVAINGEPQFLPDNQIALLQNLPGGNITVVSPNYDGNLISELVIRDTQTPIFAESSQYSLKPNTNYGLTFYSDPTIVSGGITSDANGDINGNIAVPTNLEPGYHTLHLTGKNILEEDIDIENIVYVAVAQNDYDGDGINNNDELCVGVDAIGVDYDQDGIDDACDGFIGEPPELPQPTPIKTEQKPEQQAEYNQPTQDTANPQNQSANNEPINIQEVFTDGVNRPVWLDDDLPPEVLQKLQFDTLSNSPASPKNITNTLNITASAQQSEPRVDTPHSPAQISTKSEQDFSTTVAGVSDAKTKVLATNNKNGQKIYLIFPVIGLFILIAMIVGAMRWQKA